MIVPGSPIVKSISFISDSYTVTNSSVIHQIDFSQIYFKNSYDSRINYDSNWIITSVPLKWNGTPFTENPPFNDGRWSNLSYVSLNQVVPSRNLTVSFPTPLDIKKIIIGKMCLESGKLKVTLSNNSIIEKSLGTNTGSTEGNRCIENKSYSINYYESVNKFFIV
jgi:hypothetical protein